MRKDSRRSPLPSIFHAVQLAAPVASRRWHHVLGLVTLLAVLSTAFASHSACAQDWSMPASTYYRSANVLGQSIFYREAGDRTKPTILLLHGFPSSSHSYRNLIPLLSRHYHVLAPDYLGSGYSSRPDPDQFTYTFDKLADYAIGLLDVLKIENFTIYMQDFGAPVGFRIVERRPDRIKALLIQNANAYLDGLTPARQQFFKKAHDDRSTEHVQFLYSLVSREGIVDRQYLRDIPVERRDIISPDSWTHDLALLATDKDRKIQVQLFQDYQSNIDAYPAWQGVLRRYQFPTLITWGERDPAFIAAGAKAYLRDLPKAELHLLDAGHFALEERPIEIATLILAFMSKL